MCVALNLADSMQYFNYRIQGFSVPNLNKIMYVCHLPINTQSLLISPTAFNGKCIKSKKLNFSFIFIHNSSKHIIINIIVYNFSEYIMTVILTMIFLLKNYLYSSVIIASITITALLLINSH